MARRVRQRIGNVMKWAVANGRRQDNPAEAIAQPLPKQTNCLHDVSEATLTHMVKNTVEAAHAKFISLKSVAN